MKSVITYKELNSLNLDFAKCNLDDTCLKYLLDSLKILNNLNELSLNLSDCNLTDKSGTHFFESNAFET